MNWYETWVGVLNTLSDDPELQGVVGTAIYLNGEREIELPSLTALLVTNEEMELDAPADWQFDAYGATLGQVVTMEKALMRLLHREGTRDIGGVLMFSEFIEGRTMNGPEPDRFYRRSLDFRFTPARSRYYRPTLAGS